MSFHFKNAKKDNIMTDENEENYRNKNFCRFCEQNSESDNVRDPCHLTDKHRGSVHNNCNNNVTQDQSNIMPFAFHNFSNYDYHFF